VIRYVSFIILLFALPKNLLSEDFRQIDSLAIQAPVEASASMDNLVAYCEKNIESELDRVRFYFVWIATHVDYDEVMRLDQQDPERVFVNRKAICSGYTRLMAHFCGQSGIAARYVSGYGKELEDRTSIQNHAWNVIRIGGRWHSFDVTWAANELDDERKKTLSRTFEDWFMPQPDAFQKTHLPYDPLFQLTENPINRLDFFGKEPKRARNTEGCANAETTYLNFTSTLDEEAAMDAIESTWRSFRRAYCFMPSDSAVAIKLAKAQEGKVKQAFEFVNQFSKNDYAKIAETQTETLKFWLSKLQELNKPIAEALDLHSELAFLPLLETNKQALKQNHTLFEELQNFAKKAINELISTIESRGLVSSGR
jgi:hypothetical protein